MTFMILYNFHVFCIHAVRTIRTLFIDLARGIILLLQQQQLINTIFGNTVCSYIYTKSQYLKFIICVTCDDVIDHCSEIG